MRSSATNEDSIRVGARWTQGFWWLGLAAPSELGTWAFLGVGLREYFELQNEFARLMLSLRCSWPHMVVVHQSIHVCKIHVAGENILYACMSCQISNGSTPVKNYPWAQIAWTSGISISRFQDYPFCRLLGMGISPLHGSQVPIYAALR